LRKTGGQPSPPRGITESAAPVGGSFKAQLKKVESKKPLPPSSAPVLAKDEPAGNIIDFKSRLRKTENTVNEADLNSGAKKSDLLNASKVLKTNNSCNSNGDSTTTDSHNNSFADSNGKPAKKQQQQQQLPNNDTNDKGGDLKKTEIKIDILDDKKRDSLEGNSLKAGSGGPAMGNVSSDSQDSDDKRKSTGSISSLKKLWEAKEMTPNSGEAPQLPQLSPKMGASSWY